MPLLFMHRNTTIHYPYLGKYSFWRYVLSAIILFFSSFLIEFLYTDYRLRNAYDNNTNNILNYNIFSNILYIGIFLFLIKTIHKENIKRTITFNKLFDVKKLFLGILIGVISAILAFVIKYFISYEYWVYKSPGGFSTVKVMFLNLILYSFVSFKEELLFRGYLLQGLNYHLKNKFLIILICSVFFSAYHIQYSWFGLVSVFIWGILFCMITFLENGLEYVLGIHFASNIVLVVSMIFIKFDLPEHLLLLINFLEIIFVLTFYLFISSKIKGIKP